MSATPTPWTLDRNGQLRGADGDLVILTSQPFAVGFGNRDGAKANSEFAFMAVNAHDALVEALHNMVAMARPHFSDTAQMLALSEAEAALKLARQP